MSWIHFTEYKLSINTLSIREVPGESYRTTRQPDAEVPDSKRQIQKEVLIPVWMGHNGMFDVRKTPGQSKRVQNSRLTLSHWALWKLSHNSSPAVISSSSSACHPFFSTLKTVSCWRKRLKPAAKNNRRYSPRGADIPRTSTSSIQSSVGRGLRTILRNAGN